MRCEHCGKEVAAHTRICPTCGAVIGPHIRHFKENSRYNDQAPEAFVDASSSYAEGYPPPTPGKFSARERTYDYGATDQRYQGPQGPAYQAYQQPPVYQVQQVQVGSRKNDSALIIEVILSLFGLFGIGWLTAGRTSVGLALLLGSIFIYWPVMILGTVFTLGFGLICLGPLAILAIIINAILLSSALHRQTTSYVIYNQPPPMQHPPMSMY